MISDPDLAKRARLLPVNKTQSRVVIGLLTGHSTLRRYLNITGLSNNPACRKCGTEEDISVHILCECEALASFIHTQLDSFFLDPKYIRKTLPPSCAVFMKSGNLNFLEPSGPLQSLRRANNSSRGVLPTVARRCV